MSNLITSKRRKAHLNGGGVTVRDYKSTTANSTDYIAIVFKGIDKERVPERAGLLLEDSRMYFVPHDDGFSPHRENKSKSVVINVATKRIDGVEAFIGGYDGLEYDENRYLYYIDYEHAEETRADNEAEKDSVSISWETYDKLKGIIDLMEGENHDTD